MTVEDKMAENTHSTGAADQNTETDRRYRFGTAVRTVILRLPEVRGRTGLSRATIYRKMQADEFPRSRQLGAHSVGWVESEIEDWIVERVPTGGAAD